MTLRQTREIIKDLDIERGCRIGQKRFFWDLAIFIGIFLSEAGRICFSCRAEARNFGIFFPETARSAVEGP